MVNGSTPYFEKLEMFVLVCCGTYMTDSDHESPYCEESAAYSQFSFYNEK